MSNDRGLANAALLAFFLLVIPCSSPLEADQSEHGLETSPSTSPILKEDYNSESIEDGWDASESEEDEETNETEEFFSSSEESLKRPETFHRQDEDDKNKTVRETEMERMISIPEDKLVTVVERAYVTGAEFASNLFASIVGKEMKRDLPGQDPIPENNLTSNLPPENSKSEANLNERFSQSSETSATPPPNKFSKIFKVNKKGPRKGHRRKHDYRRHQKRNDIKFNNPYV